MTAEAGPGNLIGLDYEAAEDLARLLSLANLPAGKPGIDASTFFVGRLLFFAATDQNKLRAMMWLRTALDAFIDKTGQYKDWKDLLGEKLAGKVEAVAELAIALYQAERSSGFEVEATEKGRTAVRLPTAFFPIERDLLDKHLPHVVLLAKALDCLYDAGRYYVFDIREQEQWRAVSSVVEREAVRVIGQVLRRIVQYIPLDVFSKSTSKNEPEIPKPRLEVLI